MKITCVKFSLTFFSRSVDLLTSQLSGGGGPDPNAYRMNGNGGTNGGGGGNGSNGPDNENSGGADNGDDDNAGEETDATAGSGKLQTITT